MQNVDMIRMAMFRPGGAIYPK